MTYITPETTTTTIYSLLGETFTADGLRSLRDEIISLLGDSPLTPAVTNPNDLFPGDRVRIVATNKYSEDCNSALTGATGVVSHLDLCDPDFPVRVELDESYDWSMDAATRVWVYSVVAI